MVLKFFLKKKKSSKQKFTEPAVISKEASLIEGGDPASRGPSFSLQLPGGTSACSRAHGFTMLLKKTLFQGFPSASHWGVAGMGRSPARISSAPSTPTCTLAQQEWAHSLWGSEEQKRTLCPPRAASGDVCSRLACCLHFLSCSSFSLD